MSFWNEYWYLVFLVSGLSLIIVAAVYTKLVLFPTENDLNNQNNDNDIKIKVNKSTLNIYKTITG